jgi:hypothetical protein
MWGKIRGQIEFLFKFKHSTTMVIIAMTTEPQTGYATMLVRKMEEEAQSTGQAKRQ